MVLQGLSSWAGHVQNLLAGRVLRKIKIPQRIIDALPTILPLSKLKLGEIAAHTGAGGKWSGPGLSSPEPDLFLLDSHWQWQLLQLGSRGPVQCP